MNPTMIVQALQRLCVETGSLACLGCGHEHKCSVHGCAILRAAVDLIKELGCEREMTVSCRYMRRLRRELDMPDCTTCAAYLGGGQCRDDLESECREGGGYESWTPKTRFASMTELAAYIDTLYEHITGFSAAFDGQAWALEVKPKKGCI